MNKTHIIDKQLSNEYREYIKITFGMYFPPINLEFVASTPTSVESYKERSYMRIYHKDEILIKDTYIMYPFILNKQELCGVEHQFNYEEEELIKFLIKL